MEERMNLFFERSYRFGFQGQLLDDDIKGDGNSVNYKYRMHDPRVGRFFAIDPLSPKYPHNSPYAFSENRLLDGVELEGLEFLLQNTGTLAVPRSVPFEFSLPKGWITLPKYVSPPNITVPLPPITMPMPMPAELIPQAAPRVQLKINDIDWGSGSVPASPEELGEDWVETTSSKNQTGNYRRFKNKETGEEVQYDKGKPGEPGWEGKDHWHRFNPNSKNNRDLYLDKNGNPVRKGSDPSHIEATGLVVTSPININLAEIVVRPRVILDPTRHSTWNKYYNDIKKLPNYKNIKKQYWKARWEYKQEMKKYYKELWEYHKNNPQEMV